MSTINQNKIREIVRKISSDFLGTDPEDWTSEDWQDAADELQRASDFAQEEADEAELDEADLGDDEDDDDGA